MMLTVVLLAGPPVVIWALLYWQDHNRNTTREAVAAAVRKAYEQHWMLESSAIHAMLNSAARTHHLAVGAPTVDEVLEDVLTELVKQSTEGSSPAKPAVGMPDPFAAQQRVQAIADRIGAGSRARPSLHAAFLIGAATALTLMAVLVYVPASVGKPAVAPSTVLGEPARFVPRIDSFWDEIAGVITTNVAGLLSTWFLALRRPDRPSLDDAPESADAAPRRAELW